MSITNTIATYLIFLAYINLTKFEGLISIVAVGHALRAFSIWRLVNKRVLRGRIRKDSSLFFFFFFLFFSLWSFFLFFWGGGGVWEGLFFLLFFSLVVGGLGSPWVDTWGHFKERWEMSNFWGKGQTIITLFNITKVKPSCGFQTLMLTCTVSWLTAFRLIVLHTELAEFYNDNLKDTLNSLRPTWYTIPTSS